LRGFTFLKETIEALGELTSLGAREDHMHTAPHGETALQHIQRIVTIASRPGAPITRQEAFEQIVEELELAGYGSLDLEPHLVGETGRAN
jgi:hypothetical protein